MEWLLDINKSGIYVLIILCLIFIALIIYGIISTIRIYRPEENDPSDELEKENKNNDYYRDKDILMRPQTFKEFIYRWISKN